MPLQFEWLGRYNGWQLDPKAEKVLWLSPVVVATTKAELVDHG